MIGFHKGKGRLMLYDAELTDPVSFLNHGIPHGIRREKLLIVITAIALVDDTHVIGLNDTKVFEGAASGNDMGLIPRRKLHGNA